MIRVWYKYKEQQACECGGSGYLLFECEGAEEAFEFISKKKKDILIKCITRGEVELSVKALNKRKGD